MSVIAAPEPSVKYVVKEALDLSIYTASERKLNIKLEEIMQSHSFQDPHGSMAFMYKGQIYAPEGYRPQHRISLLKRDLYELMDAWLQEQRVLLHERLAVNNYFSCLLNKAKSFADIKALLPDCMHRALSSVKNSNSLDELSLSAQEIDQFKQLHARSVQTLKERIVWNMLL
jgi:hypothetical protein